MAPARPAGQARMPLRISPATNPGGGALIVISQATGGAGGQGGDGEAGGARAVLRPPLRKVPLPPGADVTVEAEGDARRARPRRLRSFKRGEASPPA